MNKSTLTLPNVVFTAEPDGAMAIAADFTGGLRLAPGDVRTLRAFIELAFGFGASSPIMPALVTEVWREPQDWRGLAKPDLAIGLPVRLRVDFGRGETEVDGRAFLTCGDTRDGLVVYADAGGWCTTSVKAWRPR